MRIPRTSVGRRVLPVLVAATVVAATFGASAAGLGGVNSAALTATAFASSTGAPTVAVWENFDGTNGTNLNGTTTDGGAKTWTAIRGTWAINANRAKSSSADSALVVNTAQFNASVEGTVFRGTTAWDVGFTADMNAAGTQFLTAEWTSNSNGSVELWKYNGAWTSLGAVTNLYPGGLATAPASITFRLTAVGATVSASVNGTVVASATLSAADQTTFKNATHPYFGLYAYFDANSTIDNVHVDL